MKTLGLLMNNALPSLALAAVCAVITVLATVVATPIYLTSHGPYSTKQHTIYVTATTILATVLTGFITSQVQKLLLRQVDEALQEALDLKQLSRRWRVILKIADLVENVPYVGIVILYLLASLITTAIVAGLTPDLKTRSFPYHPRISHGPSDCAATIPLDLVDSDQYFWDFGNGSVFFIPANAGGCPVRNATLLAGNINRINPDAFAYDDIGVAILSSAVGTPFSVYSTQMNTAPEFNSLLKAYESSVVTTTQCVPVMTRNPVTCRPGGTVTLGAYQMNLTSSDGLCQYEAEYYWANPLIQNAMGSIMCAHGEIGQGTIVLGATKHYIQWLAGAVDDTANAHDDSVNGSTYAVTCTVDTRDVWEYRTVTLNLQNSHTSGSSFARSLVGHEPCDPAPGTNAIDDVLIATSAAANWQILTQNIYWDGYLDLLFDLTLANRPPPYAFENSANALEDVFGLMGAIIASRIDSSKVAVNGTVTVTSTTIGSGRVYAYIYLIPPAVTAVVLCYLMITTRASKVEYSSSKLVDLLDYAQTLGVSQRQSQIPLIPTSSSSVFQQEPVRPDQSFGSTDMKYTRVMSNDI
jgi:hypothetical protein